MKTRRGLLFVATLLAILLAGSPVFAARVLHVVMLGYSDDAKLSKAMRAGKMTLRRTLQDLVKGQELKFADLGENVADNQELLNALRAYSIDSDDAFLVYYCGHDAFQGDDRRPQLIVARNNQLLPRGSLLTAVRAKKAALTIFVTDPVVAFTSVPPREHSGGGRIGGTTAPLTKRLFFQHDGLIDVTSSQEDELGACHVDLDRGTFFSAAVDHVLRANRGLQEVSWADLLGQIAARTQLRFRDVFPSGREVSIGLNPHRQRTQTPRTLSLTVQRIRPTEGSGAEPTRSGPQRSVSQAFSIDPETGDVSTYQVTRQLDPRTNGVTVKRGPPTSLGAASLAVADDETTYWMHAAHYVHAEKRPADPVRGRRYLGVTVVNSNQPGVRITVVNPGSPATQVRDRQGQVWRLEPGDHILSIAGRETNDERSFVAAVQNAPAVAEMVVISGADNRRFQFAVNLGVDTPPQQRYLGVTVRNTNRRGVQIIQVEPGSPATRLKDEQGNNWMLEKGDRILAIGGRPTNDEQQFVDAVRKSPESTSISIVSQADGQRHQFLVRLVRDTLRFGATVVDRGNQLGVKITRVEANSPASDCRDGRGNPVALEAGDVITQINGSAINTVSQYQQAVRRSPPQMSITILNVRDGATMQLTTNLANNRLRFGAVATAQPNGRGVRITSVEANSPAATCQDTRGKPIRLEAGDVITSINGQAVDSVARFQQLIRESPRRMSFNVMDVNSGRPLRLTTTLRN